MHLQIVTADLHHSRVIWEWRNDPVARAISRSQEYISWENHSNWYEKFLLNTKHVMYVGLNEKLPFGIVRFDSIDNSENSFKISILSRMPICRPLIFKNPGIFDANFDVLHS